MNEDLKSMIDELSRKIAAEILGDGVGTYTTCPSYAPLTFDTLRKTIADFPPIPKGPVKLIEVEPYPVYGPVRRHRKRRIQKKWLKRYGTGIVGYEYPMGDNVLVDEKRGVGYCHPHVARRIRQYLTPPNPWRNMHPQGKISL